LGELVIVFASNFRPPTTRSTVSVLYPVILPLR
jgi:hypothetical protein